MSEQAAAASATVDEAQQEIIKGAISDALQFVATELSGKRAEMAQLYAGEKLGDEQPGRSQFVMSEVRDGVSAAIPPLVRLFFGPQRIVEFRPTKPGQEQHCRAATLALEEIFVRRSKGFLETISVLKDGLLKGMGIFKWGYDVKKTVEQVVLGPFSSPEELAAVMPANPDLVVNPERMTLEGRRETEVKEPWVKALPPEEFIFSRQARSIDDALFVGHAGAKRNGELLAMGISETMLREHGGLAEMIASSEEAIVRREVSGAGTDKDPEAGFENEETTYVEGYIRLADEHGVYGLKRICTIGPNFYPVMLEPASHARFAVFVPDPEPHSLVGFGWGDRLADIQRTRTRLMRAIFDSLSLSIFPRTKYVDGMVSLKDLLNNEVGAPIRVDRLDALEEFSHPFVGKEGIMLDQILGQIVQRRTGRDQGTAGLDANALQSSTREGVSQVIASSQEPMELLARIFAESTFKPLFRGVLQMMHEEDIAPFAVPSNGGWETIAPAEIDPDLDVTCHVALGTNFLDSRVNDLMLIASKQQEMLTTLGVNNPLVSLPQLLNTYRHIVEAKGFQADEFFLSLPPDWTPPPPPPPPPTPEQILAQAQLEIEKMKTARELEVQEAKLSLEHEKEQNATQINYAKLETERMMEEMRLAATRELELAKAKIQMETQIQIAQIRATSERASAVLKADTALETAQIQAEATKEAAAAQPETPDA